MRGKPRDERLAYVLLSFALQSLGSLQIYRGSTLDDLSSGSYQGISFPSEQARLPEAARCMIGRERTAVKKKANEAGEKGGKAKSA